MKQTPDSNLLSMLGEAISQAYRHGVSAEARTIAVRCAIHVALQPGLRAIHYGAARMILNTLGGR